MQEICVYLLIVFSVCCFLELVLQKYSMWWASGERQHVFVDLVVTQQGFRVAVGVGKWG